MCEKLEFRKISVEFQRNESLRLTEVVIINRNWLGYEEQGTKVWCYDGGRIRGGVTLIEGVDLVDVAEIRGYYGR